MFGIAQGSILGPLLFLLYVNEIELICKHSKVLLYPDNTVLYINDNNQQGSNRHMQENQIMCFAG